MAAEISLSLQRKSPLRFLPLLRVAAVPTYFAECPETDMTFQLAIYSMPCVYQAAFRTPRANTHINAVGGVGETNDLEKSFRAEQYS